MPYRASEDSALASPSALSEDAALVGVLGGGGGVSLDELKIGDALEMLPVESGKR